MQPGTIEQFFWELIAQLETEKREQPELFAKHRKAFYDKFVQMAEAKPVRSYETIRSEYRARRAREFKPLPPLQPGRARIVAFRLE